MAAASLLNTEEIDRWSRYHYRCRHRSDVISSVVLLASPAEAISQVMTECITILNKIRIFYKLSRI